LGHKYKIYEKTFKNFWEHFENWGHKPLFLIFWKILEFFKNVENGKQFFWTHFENCGVSP
jgi:hypothetical protein